jgi:hypothetical protein
MTTQQRKHYHSVPLRTRAGQQRTTDAHAIALPKAPARQASAPTQSHISHAALPTHPDDDQRQAVAPKSALRFTDEYGNEVLRQGNRQLVFHKMKQPHRLHWLFFIGIGMAIALVLFFGWQWIATSIQTNNMNSTYGMPRTYQIDAVVGHGDSAVHPSHFIFQNLAGHIIVIELPGGNIKNAHIYGGPTIYTANAAQVPVTGRFEDVNGDGRPDMILSIGTGTATVQTITWLNNGSLFVPQSQ